MRLRCRIFWFQDRGCYFSRSATIIISAALLLISLFKIEKWRRLDCDSRHKQRKGHKIRWIKEKVWRSAQQPADDPRQRLLPYSGAAAPRAHPRWLLARRRAKSSSFAQLRGESLLRIHPRAPRERTLTHALSREQPCEGSRKRTRARCTRARPKPRTRVRDCACACPIVCVRARASADRQARRQAGTCRTPTR